ncbi:MAG: Lrp/AsnC family transcriptional regulator [Archaeoglobaceae archaeon]|nr:Lrp/AsnC family transcriptional regulator [Archaeoglobaceae archaeon]MCX8152582.1 Lrp/AsnC family transcriptional regulator [Archaeoglobaceae archaeon]MDW8014136.1 Lrp/AsnC family transcriptional regulator [Archaeoglobaceae archaeon]
MALQYNLPISTTPLEDLASNLKLDYEEVEKNLKNYKLQGILKRYGVNFNYRAFSNYKNAALVGLKVDDVEKAKAINKFDEVKVKHNFLRSAEFNVWFTIKGRTLEEIEKDVLDVVEECNASDYVILPTKKIYKMDVKYDLIKGISWSYRAEPEEVPTIESFGIDEDLARKLESLPIARRPFKFEGYKEEEVVSIVEELIKVGIGRDFSGILNERKIGFNENGMFVLKTKDPEKIAKKLLKDYPQITHLVERVPSKKWNYSLYFVVHAVSKDPIEKIRIEVESFVDEVRVIYSLKNLRV